MPIGVVGKAEFDAELINLGVKKPEVISISDSKIIPPELKSPDSIEESIIDSEIERSQEISLEDALFQDLESISNEDEEVIIRDVTPKGRPEGVMNVPDSLRKLVATENLQSGRRATQELTKALGISDSSLSAYAKGATSCATYDKPSPKLLEHLNERREKIAKRASKTLTHALKEITPEKLTDMKVKDLSSVARDMSVIIKNMEPEKEPIKVQAANANQFVIFAPQVQSEEKYEVINVNEV